MKSIALRCFVIMFGCFLADSAHAQSAFRAERAFQGLRQQLATAPGAESRWSKHLNLEALEKQFGDSRPDVKVIGDTFAKLRKTEQAPSPKALEKLSQALQAYQADEIQARQLQSAVNDLRRHLKALGPRAAAWEELLGLRSLNAASPNSPEEVQVALRTLEEERKLLDDRSAFLALQRQLADW